MVQFWRADLPHLPHCWGDLQGYHKYHDNITILPQDKELARPKLHQDIISCFGWWNHRHPPPVLTRQRQERHFQWRHESEAWLVSVAGFRQVLVIQCHIVSHIVYTIRICVTHVFSCSAWNYTIYSSIYVRYWVRWAPFNLSFVTCESLARITHRKIKPLSDLYVWEW